jgi:hypothetical protein
MVEQRETRASAGEQYLPSLQLTAAVKKGGTDRVCGAADGLQFPLRVLGFLGNFPNGSNTFWYFLP